MKIFTQMNRRRTQGGFTLIEILVVIGIIALLATIVIVAINPARQFAQARNTQRTSNVNAILNAIGQRIADNKGIFAGDFKVNGTTYTCGQISSLATSSIEAKPATSSTTPSGELGCLQPTYIPSIPSDPDPVASATSTGYEMRADSAGRITVCAPQAGNETSIPNATPICVTR